MNKEDKHMSMPNGQVAYNIAILIFLFSGCSNSDQDLFAYEGRIKKLETVLIQKDKFVNLLSSELSSINNTLDSINENQFLSDSSALNPLDKIAQFDSLLNISQNKIKELEGLAKNRTSTADARLLNSIISELNNKLLEKEKKIALLRIENDSLKITSEIKSDSIFDLTELKSKLLADVAKQEGKLDSVKAILEKEKKNLETEKKGLEIEKNNLRNDLNESIEQINIEKRNSYFEFALEQLDEYNSTSANFLQGGKKKMKAKLINSAYMNFRKACLLGHIDASRYVIRLLSSKIYDKDLNIERTSAKLSACGI